MEHKSLAQGTTTKAGPKRVVLEPKTTPHSQQHLRAASEPHLAVHSSAASALPIYEHSGFPTLICLLDPSTPRPVSRLDTLICGSPSHPPYRPSPTTRHSFQPTSAFSRQSPSDGSINTEHSGDGLVIAPATLSCRERACPQRRPPPRHPASVFFDFNSCSIAQQHLRRRSILPRRAAHVVAPRPLARPTRPTRSPARPFPSLPGPAR